MTRQLRDRASEDLRRGVSAARSSSGWADLLDFAARDGVLPLPFHNVVLLQQQSPTASRVLKESDWQRLGRWPSKGSTALRLWQPRPRDARGKDLSAQEAEVAFAPPDTHPSARPGGPAFLLAPVFDLSQTTGSPIPSLPMGRMRHRGEPSGAWRELTAVAQDAGFEVCFEELSDDRSGFVAWDDRVIVLSGRDSDDPARCSSLAEQLSRLFLGRAAGDTQSDARLVSASAARITARHFGFLARDVALPQDWETAATERVRLCGSATLGAARHLVSRMEAVGVGLDYHTQNVEPPAPAAVAVAP